MEFTMKNLYKTKVKIAIFAMAIFTFFAIPIAGNLQAQDTGPSGYCIPTQEGFDEEYPGLRINYYCYPDYYPDRYPDRYPRGMGGAIEYVKMVITGPFNSGKTEFIQTVSEDIC